MALTWREVSAPDFRGVQSGISNATQMLANAASGWNDLLGQRQQMDMRDQAMALNGQRLLEDQYNFGRQQTTDAAVDGAAPAARALAVAAASGDPIAMAAARYELGQSQLPADRLATTLGNANTLQSGVLRNDGAALLNDAARTTATNLATERADTIAARDAVLNIQRMTPGSDPATQRAELEKLRATLSPGAFAKVVGQFPGAYGALGDADIPAGTLPGSEVGLGRTATTAGTAAPASSLGSSWARSVGLEKNESGGDLTSQNRQGYVGLLQFGDARLADAKAAGVVPASMTKEQFRTGGKELQDRVADWHFSDIDNQAKQNGLEQFYGRTIGGVPINRDSVRAMAHLGGMGGVTAFINSNGAEDRADANGTKLSTYGKKFGTADTSPTAAIPAMGGTGPVGRLENLAQRTTVNKAAAQQSTGVIAGIPAAREADIKGAFASDVVDQLKKTVPSLEGVPRQDVQAALTKVMQDANVGPNEAALVLRESAGGQNVWQDAKQFFGFESKPTRLDDDRIKSGIELLRSTAGDARNLQLGETVRTGAQLAAAREADVKASRTLAQAEERSKTQPLAESYMARLREEARLAEQNLRDLTNATRNDDSVRPVYPAQVEAAAAANVASAPQPQGLIQLAASRRDTPPSNAAEKLVWDARQNLRLAQRSGDPGLIQGYTEELRRANAALRAAAQ